MKCKKPFLKGGQAFGCGQCLPCRIKIRREKTTRLRLEACLYKSSSFVTLTYADAPADGVSVRDYQLFMKRWRKALLPFRLRFYGVAEYGSRFGRPHYHFVFFGIPACDETRRALHQAWGHGHIDVEEFTDGRAAYIAGYVIDKLTDVNDERLCGLNAEFSTGSTQPGLGHGMVACIADTITRHNLLIDGDVPVTINMGRAAVPLGRYLRQQVRMFLSGRYDEFKAIPASHVLRRSRVLREIKSAFPSQSDPRREAEMSHVRAVALADKENPSQLYHLLKLSEQEIRTTEAKFRLFKKRRKQI